MTLRIVSPGNATGVRVSNDGGFASARRFDVAPGGSYPWTLDSSGPERLPKTVYVRFDGPAGQSALNFTDDIILDQTPPVFRGLTVAAQTGAPPVAARRPTGTPVRLRIDATDKTSGVGSVQITNSKGKPGMALKFRSRLSFLSAGPRIYVRVRDRAGNFSPWKSAQTP